MTIRHPVPRKLSYAEIGEQNRRNKALAAEYKTARPKRRAQILEQYYADNAYFILYWRGWAEEDRRELTQIFVTYWHQAFMNFAPTSENAVFNSYMDKFYKLKTKQQYRRWLKKEQFEDVDLPEHDNGKPGNVRPELWERPETAINRALLRAKLCRNLDTQEIDLFDGHFYAGDTLPELTMDQLKKSGEAICFENLQKMNWHFKTKLYNNLLKKLSLRVLRKELLEILQQRDADMPVVWEKKYQGYDAVKEETEETATV